VKQLVKNVLAKLDVGVYRLSTFAPAEAEGFDASFLPEVDAVVDVGVAYGTGWLYHRYPAAQLVLIDPVRSPDLAGVLGGREHTFVGAALGAREGTAEMNVDLVQSGASSLLQRTELTRTGAPTERRTVDVTTLDRVTEKHIPASARIGLKLDTEGYELEVLKGGVRTLEHCAFVVCEASVLQRFEDSYRLEELVCFMRDRGFGVAAVLAAEPDLQQRIRFLDLAFLPYDEVRRNR
jgi:FkbM family methyltransferase